MDRCKPRQGKKALTAIAVILMFAVCAIFPNGAYAQQGQKMEQPAVENGMKLSSPKSVILSPNGGRLDFSHDAIIEKINGVNTVRFAIPSAAANLQISIPGSVIERFSQEPANLDIKSDISALRAKLLEQKADMEGRLLAVKSRIALLQGIPESVTAQELNQMQQIMSETIPGLVREQAALEKKLAVVDQELQQIPSTSHVGQIVSVVLANTHEDVKRARVNYSYMLHNCGWDAVYDFNARPEEGSNDVIDVRLLAEIWQYSGMDWTDTEITLATRGTGPREPQPLPEWVIDSSPKPPQPRAVPMMLNAAKARGVAEDSAEAPAAAYSPVTSDTQSVYATWKLSTKDLPEGKSRLVITRDAWKAPLEWLARPSRDDSRVFLLARYDLPTYQAWPDGTAEYCVDGQSVGSGVFHPHGGEAIIYLGADPRVNVRTTIDSHKQGEKGFINTSKTWTWAWTYTITNDHDKDIKVRLERPMPMIVDQGVTVTYDDKPDAKKDEKKHMLYWIVDVPAHGKASVEHSITITSPTKLPLLPDVP